MILDIRGVQYELDEELRQHAEQRLRAALGRFADRIDRVSLRLLDVNGPRGGIDKRCRITIVLRPRGVVRVERPGHEPFPLVSLAAKRAGRNVREELARHRRRPAPALR